MSIVASRPRLPVAPYPASRYDVARVPSWQTIADPQWGELDMLPHREDWRLDRLGTRALGALRYNHFAIDGLRLRRTPRNLSRFDDPCYVVALPMAGASRNRIDRESIEITPGRIYFLHGAVSADIQPQGRYETFNLKIPTHLLKQRVASLPTAHAAELDGSNPRAELLGHHLRHAYRVAEHLGAGEASLLEGQICDLVALMLRGAPGTCCDDRSLVAAHKRRVLDFIAANHAMEGLTAEGIARSCGISERYLHKLFHDSGQPVMERLKELRLQKAKAMLVNPALSSLPVSEVAYRNGFRSLSSFSRAFRVRFGAAPSRLRGGG
ncbi:helix-turn-helix domain-containing protein [Marilutibacter chinensis]|uniref:Helix-turn-helix domain-containing protein n=1 Tax=Marilutibacter chinensis TaxID=2912247 RepID=A0ABS9HP66_9GAMM|nr:helix-turn-helix domain-containing protein [Lysobacter chinensis]MCF7220769.1 helix-turn-helix domain-containing protein [Lysobacter chinensis]